MITLPDEFIIKLKDILGPEANEFNKAIQLPCRSSVRINPLKKFNKLSLADKIPFCETGYFLNHKPVFTLDPFFHAGHYYVQEANSMCLEIAFKELNLLSDIKILDLCAAPGGKSTHLISLLQKDAILHSHDVNPTRAEILRQNIEKWGNYNSVVTTGPIQNIINSGIKYNLIILDAPCSGEGMFRKEEAAIKQWNSNKINYCVKLQSELLNAVSLLLHPGGYLIYSTCTYNREENEWVLNKLIESHLLESVPLDSSKHYGLIKIDEKIHTYRAMPHRMEGEGFTFSILKSKANNATLFEKKRSAINPINNNFKQWINTELEDWHYLLSNDHYFACTLEMHYLCSQLLSSRTKLLHCGVPLGHFKGKDWFPSQGLASNIAKNEQIDSIELELEEAKYYLRAVSHLLPVPASSSQWQLVTYNNSCLGWVKNINKQFKNYFPKNMRIHSL
ncbi:MAG: hypothetical protein IT267_05955 [Saprospiraceae bacterium]|nr:hypothetical protein [Saprospiraceae bacterium]